MDVEALDDKDLILPGAGAPLATALRSMADAVGGNKICVRDDGEFSRMFLTTSEFKIMRNHNSLVVR